MNDMELKKLKEKNAKMESILKTISEDAIMAIDGRWDKSDEGFHDQLKLISTVIDIDW